MKRLIPALFGLVLVASACGVERDSDDVLSAETDAAEGGQPDSSAAAEEDTDSSSSGEGDATESTLAPPATPTPPTTAPPGDVALTAQLGDATVEITHGQMNDVVVPSTENEEFLELALGGARPEGFELSVLTEQLISETLQLEIADSGREVSDADLEESRERLLGQVATLFPAADDPLAEAERLYDEVPYLQFLTVYQAGQDVLTAAVIDDADPDAGNPCVSHILLDTEADAQGALDRLGDGEDFAELAIELSTGPSGPSGGDLGCAPSGNYVPAFADAVDTAELGEFVGPVETEFGFHVLVVNSYEVDGRTIAADQLRERLGEAVVDVDERLGEWDPTRLAVLPAG
ncbi:MAG: peptidylprolyl isomerase [Actinomycetota bacterium]